MSKSIQIELNRKQYRYLKRLSKTGNISLHDPVCRENMFKDLKDFGFIAAGYSVEENLIYDVNETESKPFRHLDVYAVNNTGKAYIVYRKRAFTLALIPIIIAALSLIISVIVASITISELLTATGK